MIETLSDRLALGWQRLRLSFNLQSKIILSVAASMLLILFTSSYLHTVRTRAVVEQNHYESAISQITVLTDRISRYDYFSSLEDLQQEMQLVAGSRPDFKQIDAYENSASGPRLIATTSPGVPHLASTSTDGSQSGEFYPGVRSVEISRNNNNYWLITSEIPNSRQSGFIQALVLKSAHHELVDSLHREYNLFLFAAVAASVGLLYLLFSYFFRRPLREILHAMAQTHGGKLSARAPVRRDDELGEIAKEFNQLMDDIAARSAEREDLLKQIGELNNELLRKVEVATSELRTTNANLIRTQQRLAQSERMAAIGQITASLAHEIGTPLNAVAGHLQLLGRNHREEPDTRRRLNIINGQLSAIVQTVKSLLERTHRRSATFALTEINELVRELVQLIGPMLESRSISVSIDLERALPLVLADRDSLHQVFLNLVNNSCDAMPNGGRLEITTRRCNEGRQVEIIFSDSGAGIAPNVVEHLFEPMFTTKQAGSGLGLVIAHEIIVEHRGRIELVSGSAGAVFRLTLPVAEESETGNEFIEVETNAA
jgi:two-component system, NtrC family, sensor kinase